MDEIKMLLETQPLFSLFLTVAVGFLVGEINIIKGFSLGSGAVIFVGRAIGDLDLPADAACSIVQVCRGDSDMVPRPDLILEVGDRVGVFVHRSKIKAIRSYFGDSIKGTSDFSYVSMGIGAALGLLFE